MGRRGSRERERRGHGIGLRVRIYSTVRTNRTTEKLIQQRIYRRKAQHKYRKRRPETKKKTTSGIAAREMKWLSRVQVFHFIEYASVGARCCDFYWLLRLPRTLWLLQPEHFVPSPSLGPLISLLCARIAFIFPSEHRALLAFLLFCSYHARCPPFPPSFHLKIWLF